jgi:hypothetical protein
VIAADFDVPACDDLNGGIDTLSGSGGVLGPSTTGDAGLEVGVAD